MTTSREAIFKVIESSTKHLTCDEIFKLAKKNDNKLGLATVYRTLGLLCEMSLLSKHTFGENEPVYEKDISLKDHHHHMVDLDSGKIVEFNDDEIDELLEKIANKQGYEMVGHKVEIYITKK